MEKTQNGYFKSTTSINQIKKILENNSNFKTCFSKIFGDKYKSTELPDLMYRMCQCFKYKGMTSGDVLYKSENNGNISNSIFFVVEGKIGVFQKQTNPLGNLSTKQNKNNHKKQ